MFTNPFLFPYTHDSAALGLSCNLLDDTWENCLVAAVIDEKVPQLEELVSNLNTAWHLQKPFSIDRVVDNLFRIRFVCEQDLQFILENGPWVVKNKFIAVESPDKFLANEGINVSPITVQFRYLPEKFHYADFAGFLGNIVGETMFREDQQVNFKKEASFFGVRSKVDITLPLIHKLKLPVDNGNDGWIYFEYEPPCRHCRRCGRIGHVRRECKWSRGKISEALDRLKSKALVELRKRIPDGLEEDIKIVIEDKSKGDVKVNAKKHTTVIKYVPTESDPYKVTLEPSSSYGENISNENQFHLEIDEQHDVLPPEMPLGCLSQFESLNLYHGEEMIRPHTAHPILFSDQNHALPPEMPLGCLSQFEHLKFYHGEEMIQPNTVHPLLFSDQNLVAGNNNLQALTTQEFNSPWFDDNKYRIQEGLFNHDASEYCLNWYP